MDEYKNIIQEIVNNYNDWTRSDLQAYIMAQIPDMTKADQVLQKIDTILAEKGVGI